MPEMGEDYTEVYQMYEEMLQLIKGGLDTPSKEIIEAGGEIEEKKAEDDDDEGFNDERDEEFSRQEHLAGKNVKSAAPIKKNLQQRFDQTLTTVQEESEPENTF